MTHELAIGNRATCSWSLRGWLLFEKFNLPVTIRSERIRSDAYRAMMADFAPARSVPAARLDGVVVYDTLALAETLNELHPEAAMLPADPAARGLARSITAEMHSGFTALRNDCSINLLQVFPGFEPSEAVLADVARIEAVWEQARAMASGDGPWLFGAYSIADAFYAPIAARFASYGVQPGDDAAAYVATHLADPAFRRWRAMAAADKVDPTGTVEALLPEGWPGPDRRPARTVNHGPSENDRCPYSGKPVTHFMELDGRVFGFCNAFCRDKTVADAAAWESFQSIYQK
jgi:glutathione S-transferase